MIEEIFKSVFFNYVYDKFKEFKYRFEEAESKINLSNESEIILHPEIEDRSIKFKIRIFRVDDIESILSIVEKPVFHFIIDDTPSAYFSVSAVIESQVTSEWYIIGSGEFAFQGYGGGYRKSIIVSDIIKKKNLDFTLWCTTEELLSQFHYGELSWLQLKPQLIPFLSVWTLDDQWKEVIKRVKELFPRLARL